MKSGINHVVPSWGGALTLLREQHAVPRGTGDFVFPAKEGRPLSNMSTEMVLRRMKRQSVTVHGFGSSFRDWAGEITDHARETAEAALAHAVGNEVAVTHAIFSRTTPHLIYATKPYSITSPSNFPAARQSAHMSKKCVEGRYQPDPIALRRSSTLPSAL